MLYTSLLQYKPHTDLLPQSVALFMSQGCSVLRSAHPVVQVNMCGTIHLCPMLQYRGPARRSQKQKEQIAVCKREFQAAMRAGDVQKQRLYESWIYHWHQKLAEEKRVAQKKVQPTK